MALVSDVITTVQQVYLNDFSGTVATSARLFPLVKEAYLQLQLFLRTASDPRFRVNLSDTSQYIAVAAGTKNITASLGQDTFIPVRLWERLAGSTDDVVLMTEKEWEPAVQPTNQLLYWIFRNGIIRFIGATVNVEVRVDYITGFAALATTASLIGSESGEAFLAPWTAALWAEYIMKDLNRAATLKQIATTTINQLLDMKIGKNQSLPVRAGRYRGFRQTTWG